MNKNISDNDLLVRISQSDKRAFEMLFKRYWGVMFQKSFFICKNKSDAKDVVQEVWIDLWKRRTSIHCKTVKTYLVKASQYASYKKQKDKNKVIQLSKEMHHQMDKDDAILSKKEIDHKTVKLKRAFSKVPTRCKQILKLRFENGLTNSEISKELNISIRSVETQVSKSYKIIRKNFDEF